jgi:hypothetical protein
LFRDSKSVDPNKLVHIFRAKHKLDDVVKHYGSEEAAYRAIEAAADAVVKAQGLSGQFEVVVSIAGVGVTVRGMVVNGVTRIGTAWK